MLYMITAKFLYWILNTGIMLIGVIKGKLLAYTNYYMKTIGIIKMMNKAEWILANYKHNLQY